ncbi:MAG: hypothetical protein QUU85_13390, partial [Candidatus Eisenbacteria bacterium]|nr:hypothetical protein [Candidatus Eisenbacteria bacterium]
MRLSHTIRHRPVHGAPASRSLAAAFVIGVASCWSAGAEATVIPVGQSRQVSAFAFLDPGQGQEPLRCDRT